MMSVACNFKLQLKGLLEFSLKKGQKTSTFSSRLENRVEGETIVIPTYQLRKMPYV
jgi:hypothetical protein